nr:MAG TPA: hypothetical protein [Caudoviricetes sp.]
MIEKMTAPKDSRTKKMKVPLSLLVILTAAVQALSTIFGISSVILVS